MTTVNLPITEQTREQASNFCAIVQMSRNYLLKPACAIVTLEVDGLYCGAILILYAAETHSVAGDIKQIPLTPYFYTGDVASWLETTGVIVPVHETKKTGVYTVWCEISQTLI